MNLFDAIAARDEAVDRVEANAHEDWLAAARLAVRSLAYAREYLTTDDLWELLERDQATTHEPRAMGPVMKGAVRDGLIEPDTYVRSKRPTCHARPILRYRSKVWSPR